VLTQCFQLSPFVIRGSLAKSFKSFGNHLEFSFKAISKKLKASNGSLWWFHNYYFKPENITSKQKKKTIRCN